MSSFKIYRSPLSSSKINSQLYTHIHREREKDTDTETDAEREISIYKYRYTEEKREIDIPYIIINSLKILPKVIVPCQRLRSSSIIARSWKIHQRIVKQQVKHTDWKAKCSLGQGNFKLLYLG